MKATELVNKCLDIAYHYKTVYMWGCVGSPVTQQTINSKAAQYPDWYTAARKARFQSLIGQDYWGFDCVNLIKAVLWGWNGDKTKTYGGAKYASNGVPDVSANGAIQLCKNVTSDFTKEIPIGAALWCSGHIGLYIGNGLGVECTPIWKNGVQVTAVKNIGQKSGYNARQWTKWGLLPWVDYSVEKPQTPAENQTNSDTGKGDDDVERWKKITDVPAGYYREQAQRLINEGVLKGKSDGTLDLTEDMLRTILIVERIIDK